MDTFRFIPVVVLLGVAAALLTDRNKLPLALRGLRRVAGGGSAGKSDSAAHRVSRGRRLAAFALILAAFALAVWP